MDYPLASLEGLPDDVLAHVFELLDSKALAGLRVSRRMDVRVSLSHGVEKREAKRSEAVKRFYSVDCVFHCTPIRTN
jgi:hypothetical protein